LKVTQSKKTKTKLWIVNYVQALQHNH